MSQYTVPVTVLLAGKKDQNASCLDKTQNIVTLDCHMCVHLHHEDCNAQIARTFEIQLMPVLIKSLRPNYTF
jgi:hypothetical protein